jgi:hypothetical protein
MNECNTCSTASALYSIDHLFPFRESYGMPRYLVVALISSSQITTHVEQFLHVLIYYLHIFYGEVLIQVHWLLFFIELFAFLFSNC